MTLDLENERRFALSTGKASGTVGVFYEGTSDVALGLGFNVGADAVFYHGIDLATGEIGHFVYLGVGTGWSADAAPIDPDGSGGVYYSTAPLDSFEGPGLGVSLDLLRNTYGVSVSVEAPNHVTFVQGRTTENPGFRFTAGVTHRINLLEIDNEITFYERPSWSDVGIALQTTGLLNGSAVQGGIYDGITITWIEDVPDNSGVEGTVAIKYEIVLSPGSRLGGLGATNGGHGQVAEIVQILYSNFIDHNSGSVSGAPQEVQLKSLILEDGSGAVMLMPGKNFFYDTDTGTISDGCFGPGVSVSIWGDGGENTGSSVPIRQGNSFVPSNLPTCQKNIEDIRPGDMVTSFDADGNLVPGRVTRVFQNDAKILLNFHGTMVTPGHVYYRADSQKAHKFETLIDVLREDGVIETAEGTHIRAATDVPVGDPRDGFVKAITGTRQADGTVAIKDEGRIRLGTRFLVDGKRSYAVADLIAAGGGTVGADEMIRVADGAPMPFHWEFGDSLPKPEDFVLACSNTTLEAIYKAAEWESQGPRLAAPMVLDGGPVKPLSPQEQAQMPRNEPLTVTHVGARKPVAG